MRVLTVISFCLFLLLTFLARAYAGHEVAHCHLSHANPPTTQEDSDSLVAESGEDDNTQHPHHRHSYGYGYRNYSRYADPAEILVAESVSNETEE